MDNLTQEILGILQYGGGSLSQKTKSLQAIVERERNTALLETRNCTHECEFCKINARHKENLEKLDKIVEALKNNK